MARRVKLGMVVFETGGRCNLACRYCYNTWKGGGGSELPPADYVASRRTLRRLFRQAKVEHIGLSGGEPMLAERLPELALYCRMKGVAVSVVSNGNAGAPEDFRRLLELGVAHFVLPLHSGTAEAHDAMTGRPGSWRRSCETIAMLREMGGTVVGSVILSRLNFQQVTGALRLLQNLGLSRVMLNRFNLGGSGLAEATALLPEAEELRLAFTEANELVGELGLTLSSNIATPHCLLDPADYPRIAFARCSADPARRPLALEPGGNLRFCNHSPVVFGNIFKESLESILAPERIAGWELMPSACGDCAVGADCLGGCRAAAEQVGESLTSPDPVLAELGLEPDPQRIRSYSAGSSRHTGRPQ
jgi:radical SAM protein with 4Fe4S-binding SPASM domain